MTDELKPCPFCGRNAVWFKTGRDIGIECGDGFDCPGRAQTNVYGPEHRQDVIDQWNRRATPEAAEPVAEVVAQEPYLDGTPRGNTLRWAGRNCENDFPAGTKLYAGRAPTDSQAGRDAVEARSQAATDVLSERRRQIEAEGWTPEHDDEHGDGSMARAAACYALDRASVRALEWSPDVILWPWDNASWKPRDKRSNLVRAGALILAEIERLDRTAAAGRTPE
jgi:Lar family restriction alleviation protein